MAEKWIARETRSTHHYRKGEDTFSQTTSITISTEKEAVFDGKSIASVSVAVPEKYLTERDGAPDGLAILINKGHYPIEEAMAHAKLIAAAPDLLEACKEVYENKYEPDKLLCIAEGMVKDAIAKAKD